MAFRFILWGDSSQNDNFADSYTKQAENNYRTTHQIDFESLSTVSEKPFITPDTNNSPSSAPATNNVVSTVVAELIQAVTENKKTETVANEINTLIGSGSDTKGTPPNLASSILNETAKSDVVTSEIITDKAKTIKSVAETISSVSQALNEQSIVQNNNSSLTGSITDETSKNLLLQKMRSFLDELKTKVLSLLGEIQKPQLQYYYGAEDTVKDAQVKEAGNLQEQKQKEIIEERINRKTTDRENERLIKDTQIKLEKELKNRLIKQENQSEMEQILSKRIEEARKRNMFETNFLPK